jgi:hypothetical protein
MSNCAAWFYAEPCRAEKHVQEDKRNMHWTELEGGGGGGTGGWYLVSRPIMSVLKFIVVGVRFNHWCQIHRKQEFWQMGILEIYHHGCQFSWNAKFISSIKLSEKWPPNFWQMGILNFPYFPQSLTFPHTLSFPNCMFHHALTVAPTISFGRIDTPIFRASVEVQMGTNSAKYSDMHFTS